MGENELFKKKTLGFLGFFRVFLVFSGFFGLQVEVLGWVGFKVYPRTSGWVGFEPWPKGMGRVGS